MTYSNIDKMKKFSARDSIKSYLNYSVEKENFNTLKNFINILKVKVYREIKIKIEI